MTPWAFVAVLMVVAVNLRLPFVDVAPIAGRISSSLATTAGQTGLLTSLPVLCFGLAAPVGLLVARRTGADRAVLVFLTAVVAGQLLRSGGGFGVAVLGTLVLGLGITLGNIVLPVLIRRDVPRHAVGLVTGLYTSVMNVGSMVVQLATAPLALLLGWRLALVCWTAPALLAAAVWTWSRRRAGRPSAADAQPATASADLRPGPGRPPWRNRTGWLLALAFAAQAACYYSMTAWLPTLLADTLGLGPTPAGAASSVFQVFALVGALGVPVLGLRLPAWAPIAVVGLLWIAFPTVLVLAPHLFLLGSVLGGAAQGGGFAAVFTVVIRVSRSDRDSARLSAFVQGVGYTVAAAGPPLLGVLHEHTGGWTWPLLVVLASASAFAVLGVAAAHRARLTVLPAG